MRVEYFQRLFTILEGFWMALKDIFLNRQDKDVPRNSTCYNNIFKIIFSNIFISKNEKKTMENSMAYGNHLTSSNLHTLDFLLLWNDFWLDFSLNTLIYRGYRSFGIALLIIRGSKSCRKDGGEIDFMIVSLAGGSACKRSGFTIVLTLRVAAFTVKYIKTYGKKWRAFSGTKKHFLKLTNTTQLVTVKAVIEW